MVRALYDFKGVGSEWEAVIREVIRDLGFQPCMADADISMRSALDTSAIESSDFSLNRSPKNLLAGERYWEYVLICVEKQLLASRRAKCTMESISGV